MKLLQLRAELFRNIHNLNINVNARINVVHGDNGSGKSSLLEMIYCLSRGRSFRTRVASSIVQYDQRYCTVFARLQDDDFSTSIGFRKEQHGKTTIKVGHQASTPTASELSHLLPVQLFHPDSHDFLNGGPAVRRKFIDWGLFYTNPRFIEYWSRFHQALKQRNASLNQKQSLEHIRMWDTELALAGEELSQCRLAYVEQLTKVAQVWISALVGKLSMNVSYDPGWDNEQSLLSILRANVHKDQKYGYTVNGPHRFDLRLQVNDFLAERVLSRGEQKRLICALYLAQGQIFRQTTQQGCVYLLDDILSELDAISQGKLLEALQTLDAQIFVTTLDLKLVEPLLVTGECNQFHLVQGRLQ